MLGRTWLDPNRGERGLEALRQYRREWDDRLKDWKANPLHNFACHGADALRYFAVGFDESQITPPSSIRRKAEKLAEAADKRDAPVRSFTICFLAGTRMLERDSMARK